MFYVCFYLWEYLFLCFFMQHILQLCTHLCSCQAMFYILHPIYALPCSAAYNVSYDNTFLCSISITYYYYIIWTVFYWTLALLENAPSWTSSQSVLHVCVSVYPSQLAYCGFIQCCVAISRVGQHLATCFAEWRYTNQTVNGSLRPAKPFSFSYYHPHWCCTETGWIVFILCGVDVVECRSRLESLAKKLAVSNLHNQWWHSLGGFASLWIRKRAVFVFWRKRKAK